MPHVVTPIRLSVIAPAHNERENVARLVAEIDGVLDRLDGDSEIVIVDDGSTDDTLVALQAIAPCHYRLRIVRMQQTPAGRGNGQSAAFHAGVRASRGQVVAMMDADLQNDPRDIPAMLELLRSSGADMVQGDRSVRRRDGAVRRASAFIGRYFRRWLLGDTIIDTGCSLRVMRREVAVALPLEFRGMHRFIPITARQMGFSVVEMPVQHRPRVAGRAKYGIWNRALPGLIDCLAVRWMARRRRPVSYKVIYDAPEPQQPVELAANGSDPLIPHSLAPTMPSSKMST